jgi:glyoxylase-like metal-dependent hydrolase (beta-lactamase superfamily II)
LKWHEVGDGVFTCRYEFFDQQIGVVVSRDDVVVIDTRSTPAQGSEIVADLREITKLPVSVVINTHWHFDHTFGNAAIKVPAIWGHVRTADRLRREGPAKIQEIRRQMPELAAELETLVIEPPNQTFDDRASVQVGDRILDLAFHGRAHTDGDITITVRDTDVMFAGDVIEESGPPNFGDSYPLDWPDTLARIFEVAPKVVVPGHGAVQDRAFVQKQLAGIRALVDLARDVAAGSLDRETALARSPFEPVESGKALDRALAQLSGQLK